VRRNIIPDKVRIGLDIRLVHGDAIEDVVRRIRATLSDLEPRVQVEVTGWWPATSSPLSGRAWRSMERAARSLDAEARLLPTPIVAATDARFYRQLGIPAYGFGFLSDRLKLTEYWARFHGRDERIDVDSLYSSCLAWERLIEDLTGDEGRE
jgi:acetylornithine deacetylase/succinyl-diaminopimelate desuccinylase-like protein